MNELDAKAGEFQIKFLCQMGLQPDHKVLDLGCGTLRGGIPIIQYLNPGNYIGIDIRPIAIAKAHQRIAEANLADKKPIVFVSNNFGYDEVCKQLFDYIWCFQMLYLLEDKWADDLFQKVSQIIKPTSLFFATVNFLKNPGKWREFYYVKRPMEFYESLAKKHLMSMKNWGQVTEFGFPQQDSCRFDYLLEFRFLPN